ncbi:hypothetical protein KKE92_05635 [Candidatus Micrarchaeota archaeon]|nr:hypothetical protein [Candidatus Micrarchaeota archaeon]MBU1681247.1 hypothetical protein [Candidatus Micrarchaeota archaeon]
MVELREERPLKDYDSEFLDKLRADIGNGILQIYLHEYSELLPEQRRLKDAIGSNFLERICGADLEKLKKIHYCIRRSYVEEFNRELEAYFRNIVHKTSNRVYPRKGFVRGKIEWKRTFEGRLCQGKDMSLFFCKEIEKDYDLPENLILKFLLLKIDSYISSSKLVKEGDENIEEWKVALAKLKHLIDRIKKNVYFKEIGKNLSLGELEQAIGSRTEYLAKNSRSKFIREQLISRAYAEYKMLMVYNYSNTLDEVIKKTILSPKNNSRLYELFALNCLLLNFIQYTKKGDLKPFRGTGDQIVSFELPKSNTLVYIYDNTLPTNFVGKVYPNLKKRYFPGTDLNSVDEQSRRPDIIIELVSTKNGTVKREYIILEVKLTRDKGYIKESLYKVMGYLYDFYFNEKDMFAKQAILLVHEWEEQRNIVDSSYPIILLNYMNYNESIKEIVLHLTHKRLNIL